MDANNIKRISAKLKLSQSEFAELLGINLRTLQNWEIDRNPPNSAAVAWVEWFLAIFPASVAFVAKLSSCRRYKAERRSISFSCGVRVTQTRKP